MEDQELLVGIQNKKEDYYEILVDKYMRYVGAIVSKVAGNRLGNHDIEEICADTFIKIWTNAENIQLTRGSLKPYMAIVARNHTLNVLRAKEKRLEEELEEDILTYESAENLVVLKEEKNKINKLIADLPEPDREIFIRRYFYMEKVKDIARRIGMTEKAVSARISRTKDKLQTRLKEKNIL